MQFWAVIMGMVFLKDFFNWSPGLSRKEYLKTLLALFSTTTDFFLLLFFLYTTSLFSSLLLFCTGGHRWKCPWWVCVTVCVLAVPLLPRLPGTAHTLQKSVFIQADGYPRAKLRWRQPKACFFFLFSIFWLSWTSNVPCFSGLPPTSQSQAVLLGTNIFSSPTFPFLPGGNFCAFHSGLISCVLLEVVCCSWFPFQKSCVFGQGWGLFYFVHMKEVWALWTTSYAQESSSGLQYRTAISAQTSISHRRNSTFLIMTKSFRSMSGCFSLHKKLKRFKC